jgi:hypothetical protein
VRKTADERIGRLISRGAGRALECDSGAGSGLEGGGSKIESVAVTNEAGEQSGREQKRRRQVPKEGMKEGSIVPVHNTAPVRASKRAPARASTKPLPVSTAVLPVAAVPTSALPLPATAVEVKVEVERVTCDIAHLWLPGLPGLRSADDSPTPAPSDAPNKTAASDVTDAADGELQFNRVVGISKHLCGAATDLAIRCLMHYDYDSNGGNSMGNSMGGANRHATDERGGDKDGLGCAIVFALCCHHRCSWPVYVAKDWLMGHGMRCAGDMDASNVEGNGTDGGEAADNIISNKGGDFEAMRRLSKAAHSRGKIDLAGAKQRKQQKLLKRQARLARLAAQQEGVVEGMEVEPVVAATQLEGTDPEVTLQAEPEPAAGSHSGSSARSGGGGGGGGSHMTSGSRAELAALRSEVGVMSKRLLDEGRAAWLRRYGWEARLVQFVEKGTSPENTLLIATKRN